VGDPADEDRSSGATARRPLGRLLELAALTAVFGAAASIEHATAEQLPWFAVGAVALLAVLAMARLGGFGRARRPDPGDRAGGAPPAPGETHEDA